MLRRTHGAQPWTAPGVSDLMRVLVIDDDDSIREFVSLALADEGYDVHSATDGQAALNLIATDPPDLILLDMRMPVMDGWEFARRYRERPGPQAPIVVITAAHEAANRAAQIGAQDHLSKPFKLESLFDLVEKYAGLSPHGGDRSAQSG